MCQLSIFLTSVLHMKSIFTEKMESLCLCSALPALRHVLAAALTRLSSGEGPGRHLSASLASVISGHSAVLGGLRKGGEEHGGSLSLMKAKFPPKCLN